MCDEHKKTGDPAVGSTCLICGTHLHPGNRRWQATREDEHGVKQPICDACDAYHDPGDPVTW